MALSHPVSYAAIRRSVCSPSGSGAERLWWSSSRRERAVDLLVVVAILALAVAQPRGLKPEAETVGFGVALALPLLWRRQRPKLVFGLIAAVAFIQWLCHVNTAADTALLVAAYTVADRCDRRSAVGVTMVLGLGAILASVRFPVTDDRSIKTFVALCGLSIAAALMGVRRQDRRALLDSLEERAARLEFERDQQGELVAAAERARIARDMHDIVAHNLTVMIALTDGAGRVLKDSADGAATEAIAAASFTGRQALSEMRLLLGVLRDDEAGGELTPQPGIAEIEQLVEQLRVAGLPVRLTITGGRAALPDGLQLTAFRIVQEALTNVLRHAHGAVSADVEMCFHPDRLDLTVTNTGIPAPDAATGPGRGIRGMRERAQLYDGQIEAGPGEDGGWQVTARLPLRSSAQNADGS